MISKTKLFLLTLSLCLTQTALSHNRTLIINNDTNKKILVKVTKSFCFCFNREEKKVMIGPHVHHTIACPKNGIIHIGEAKTVRSCLVIDPLKKIADFKTKKTFAFDQDEILSYTITADSDKNLHIDEDSIDP